MKTHTAFKSALLAMSALGLLAVPAIARAEGAAASETMHDFEVPAQPLARSLSAIAEQADIQVVYPDKEPLSIDAPAVHGRMTVSQALGTALAGSGYTFQYLRAGVVTLIKAGAGGNDGERVTGMVSVEGVQESPYFGRAGQTAGVNGINGSRDITATEGTGSFTSGALTIGSKVPQAMKDVPQSISVLTSERMAQQNITDFTTALADLPGVTLAQGTTSLESTFYSRGFAIKSIAVDGGAPLATGFGYSPQIDMSIYDHVELLRGAAGQFNGYGDPGGTVNLVRKKPLDHSQVTLEGLVGSWDNYRIVADATSPLALDGKLRGRLVMTYQDNDHFYDVARDSKTLVYGIAELDATPTTLVTAGISYTRQESVPNVNGLPRYLDGGDLKLPRSTCLCFDWNRWDFATTEIFGSVDQKIAQDWQLKLNLTYNHQTSTQKIGYSAGAVNPTNGLGPQFNGQYNGRLSRQLSAEATLSGSFTLFGQRQEVTVGANRVDTDGGGQVSYGSLVNTLFNSYQPYPGGPVFCQDYGLGSCPAGSVPSNPPIDVFDFDPSNPLYTEPANPLPTTRYTQNGQVQTTAYISLRLTAFDRLHLTTGLRWSRYESKTAYDSLCTPTGAYCTVPIGEVYSTYSSTYSEDDFSWPPSATLSFDVTKNLTAYAGYTDIYRSQANYLDSSGTPLPPITGANWEGGFKWAPHDGRLNLSVSAYRIRQKGLGNTDPANPVISQVAPGILCCLVADPDMVYQSKGFDAEATGELARGWQISASYTFNDNQYKGSSFGTSAGQPFVPAQPKHLYRIWTSYDFGAAGRKDALSGLTLSAGLNGQSSAYSSGRVCVHLAGTPNSVTGAQSCASFAPPDYVPFKFTVPAYALFSARIDYRFSDAWSLAFNLDNIFDKTYYQTTGTQVTGGNWYGAPRSFTATLRAKW